MKIRKVVFITTLLLCAGIAWMSAGDDLNKKDISMYAPAAAMYHSLVPSTMLPPQHVFELAYTGYQKLNTLEKLFSKPVISVIDFSMSSNEKRMWIIDLESKKVLFNTLVAHGRNTGEEYAESFSNRIGSYQSSLGFYKTGETYQGKHGYSLRLDGLEQNINDNAMKRAIVIHGADYVDESFASSNGRLGRSLGCPAVPNEIAPEIIDVIKDNTLLFIYFPSRDYLKATNLI